MRVYLMLGAAVAMLLAVIGAFIYGRHTGVESAEAKAARESRAAQIEYDKRETAAARRIAILEATNGSLKNRLETELLAVPDCHAGADVMRSLNEIRVGPEPAGDSELPPAG